MTTKIVDGLLTLLPKLLTPVNKVNTASTLTVDAKTLKFQGLHVCVNNVNSKYIKLNKYTYKVYRHIAYLHKHAY